MDSICGELSFEDGGYPAQTDRLMAGTDPVLMDAYVCRMRGYEVQDVYAKKGLTDDSYVVYVVFNYICTGIETPVPALSEFYVETGSDGNLKIKGGADDAADISA